MRQQHFDILLDTSQWARIGALLAWASGARYTVGFETPGQKRHFAYDLTVPHLSDRHESANFRALLDPLGVSAIHEPRIRTTGEARQRVAGRISRPYVVCHAWPSGRLRHLKEWPAAHWHALARALAAEGYDVVFTGGPADREATAALIAPMRDLGPAVHDVSGQMSLMETAAVIERAAGLVSVNTGIMHVGAAVGVPLVELNGPTRPLRWGPLSRNAISLVVEDDDACYLNLGWEGRRDAKPVTDRIRPDEVLSSLHLVISRKSRVVSAAEPEKV
jgi:ADP-heptose:LPS heptosyltransferase